MALGCGLRPVLGQMRRRVPPPPAGSLELPEPSQTGLGVHLFYAIQWWLFIVIALVGFGTVMRRESRAGDHAGAGDTEDAEVH